MYNYFAVVLFDDFRISSHSIGQTNEFNGGESGASRRIRSDTRWSSFILQEWGSDRFVLQLQIVVGNTQWCRLAVGCATWASIFQARTLRWFANTEDICVICASDLILFAFEFAHIISVRENSNQIEEECNQVANWNDIHESCIRIHGATRLLLIASQCCLPYKSMFTLFLAQILWFAQLNDRENNRLLIDTSVHSSNSQLPLSICRK